MESVGVRHPLPGVVYQTSGQLKSYRDQGILTDETLVSAFEDAVRRFPKRTALSEVGWSCTYAELDVMTDKAASAFMRLGLQPQDRVLFQLPNSRELVVAFLACIKAGLIPVCTLAAHRQIEIGYLGKHASARAHIVPANDPRFDFISFAEDMHKDIPSLAITIATKGNEDTLKGRALSLDDLIKCEDADAARQRVAAVHHDPFQVAIFQLSGGTTDVPKIIPRCHNEYLYTLRTVVNFHGLDESVVSYTSNPMMHNAPMACVWGPAIFFGGEVAIAGSLEAAAVGPLLQQRRPNWMFVPQVVLLRLKEDGWFGRIDLTGVKGFSTPSRVEKLGSFLGGAPVWPLFGMTEGLLAYCNESDPLEARHNTVGRPLSEHDEIRILGPGTEDELPDGEIGELAVRGPCTITGYFNAEDRNTVAFTRDGFYRSGDLMRIEVIEGRRYLTFEGRLKDVVSRGGEKINCEEVERIAIDHPCIASIAIVAMPDHIYVERACAFVIPAPNRSITIPELGAFLAEKGLAKFKWPERIELVADFPTTSSGKLSKPKLRELIVKILKDEESAQPVPRAQII